MKHDTAIPIGLHTGTGDSVKEALGSFWSTLFKDRELVDAAVSARVLSACQAYIDIMEALSLRDHSGIPVFHREHWHPLLIRLSERNTGCGLKVGMEGDPKLGAQSSASIFKAGEVFVVGGNAEFSKVDTYPLDESTRGSLVGVATCICDAIAEPEHILMHGRDFMLRDGVLLIRKEHDPFTAGGYRIVEDGDDRIAVLWMCDAEFDREHVGDFLAYPLGFDVKSTPESARMLSALWDAVIYGLTPRHMNVLLGALFDVPVVKCDTVVEDVRTSGSIDTVVTGDGVYMVPHSLKAECVTRGSRLAAGTFLTNELAVYHGLSKSEVESLIGRGVLTSLELPAGSIAGVDSAVTIANADSPVQERPGHDNEPWWFKLGPGDSRSSDFWNPVLARMTEDERLQLFEELSGQVWRDNMFHFCEYAAHPTAWKLTVPAAGTSSVDINARSLTLQVIRATGVYTKWARNTTLDNAGMMGIPVSGNVSYTVSCTIASSGTVWCFFFDSEKRYISTGQGQESLFSVTDRTWSKAVTSPANARYMSLFFYTTSSKAVFSDIWVRRTDSPRMTVNPLRSLGYLALANTVLVHTSKAPIPGVCAAYALDVLKRLMPAYGSVQVIQSAPATGSSFGMAAVQAEHVADGSTVTMGDAVELEVTANAEASSEMCAASDGVALRFIPDAATEV